MLCRLTGQRRRAYIDFASIPSRTEGEEAQLYTTAEVAAGFGVGESTVRMWVKNGKIIPTQTANLRGDHRFSLDEIQRFASENHLRFSTEATHRNN